MGNSLSVRLPDIQNKREESWWERAGRECARVCRVARTGALAHGVPERLTCWTRGRSQARDRRTGGVDIGACSRDWGLLYAGVSSETSSWRSLISGQGGPV